MPIVNSTVSCMEKCVKKVALMPSVLTIKKKGTQETFGNNGQDDGYTGACAYV